MKRFDENKCAYCENCIRTVDHRNWVHYGCEFAPGIEFLKDFPSEPLNPTCGHFKPTELYNAISNINKQERQKQISKEILKILENKPFNKYNRDR